MNPRTRGIIKTLVICLTASTGLSALKIFYGQATESLSFIADGIHSLFDSLSTVIGIISIYTSQKPPDEGHPYGHQKFETLASLALALLMFLAAYEVGTIAYEKILNPHHVPHYSFTGILLLLFTLFINFGISWYEKRAALLYRSSFLESDSIHNLSDFLITAAVFIGLVSSKYQIRYVDSAVAIAITLYLIFLGVHLLKVNIQPLLDQRVLDSKAVENVVYSVKDVLHCHHIRSRGEGNHHFLDLHIHLDPNMSLNKAHDISHEVEHKLKNTFPGLVDVVIHMEPHEHEPCEKEKY
jgi:cation diffusion facilitator family transporter